MSLGKRGWGFGALLCLGFAWTGAAADAPKTIAVFPFTIQDTSGAPTTGQKERLADATKELARVLAATGQYKPVDLGPYQKQMESMQSPEECGECWANLAKKAGAEYEIIPSVQKVSVLISQMTMWVANVEQMKYSRLVQGQIRGDTGEAYTRGIDFLVNHELLKKQP